jgi:radical SAM protein with 4Fe4S-binding SPASM domain
LAQGECLRIVNSAAKAGVSHIEFTGGEIFLREDALEVIKQASELGMTTSVVTNGLLLTDEVLERLGEYHTITFLSIDGATKETHEGIRGLETWESTLSAAQRMCKRGIEFSPVMAISKLNRTEVQGYLSLAKDLGCTLACLIPVMPVGRASRDIVLGPRDMVAVIKEVEEQAERLKILISLWCTPFARLITYSPWVQADFCRESEEIDLDPRGNVLLCDILDTVLANVEGKEILGVWKEQEQYPLVKSLAAPKLREPCLNCSLRDECQGGCFARAQLLTGDIYAPDPLCPRVGGII